MQPVTKRKYGSSRNSCLITSVGQGIFYKKMFRLSASVVLHKLKEVFLEECFLIKELQVKTDPDFACWNFMQQ